jgi:glycosyltransferase involved in cell wall biosynthesis
VKISVILPVYNVAEYIESCLKSVVNQDFLSFECLLIDDCSTDNSLFIIEDFVSKYNGLIEFKIIKKEINEGLSEARNTGVNSSTGEYLYFLDSDDEIFHDTLSYLSSKVELFNCDMACGEFTNDLNFKFTYQNLVEEEYYHEEVCYAIKRKVNAWNKLIRKSFIVENNINFEPNIYHEDRLWNFEILLKMESIFLSNKTTYFYRIRPNSIITDISKFEKRIDDSTFIIKKMEEILKVQNISKNKRMIFLNYLESLRYGVCLSAFSHSQGKAKHVFNNLDPKYSIQTFFYLELSNIIKNACWIFGNKFGFEYFNFFYKLKYNK